MSQGQFKVETYSSPLPNTRGKVGQCLFVIFVTCAVKLQMNSSHWCLYFIPCVTFVVCFFGQFSCFLHYFLVCFLWYIIHVSVVVCFLLCLISCLFVKYWTKKQAAGSPPRMENIYFCSVFVPSPNWPKPHQQ